MLQMIKDNREYKQYIKTEGIKNIKRAKALKDIEISEEQLKEAKRLQRNTFKAFNKLDEKSQQYAESVEAVGEVINVPLTAGGAIAGSVIGGFLAKAFKGATKQISDKRIAIGVALGAIIGVIPSILNNIYFTKQQKQASRVAHMLALDEMKDYKKFADYGSQIQDKAKSEEPQKAVQQTPAKGK